MSPEAIASLIIALVQGYLGIGFAFGLVFVLLLVQRMDASARGSTWGFRLLVLPGVVLLWPLLLTRVLARRHTPVERNAHRVRAACRAAAGDAGETGG